MNSSSRELSSSDGGVREPAKASAPPWGEPTLRHEDNPFWRPHDHQATPTVEAWARALCIASGAAPDPIIGYPPAPRWVSWVGYAERSVLAAVSLGIDPTPVSTASPAEPPVTGPGMTTENGANQ